MKSIKYFLNWEEAFQSSAGQTGGKGWNIARLAKYGFKIPIGGVLTTEAYHELIQTNGLQDLINSISNLITVENMDGYLDLLLQLRKKIMASSLSLTVVEELAGNLNKLGITERALAIRSSASAEDSAQASFAGVHESFLNVHGLENILAAIKGCYASLWSPQAVAYRRKLNIADNEVVPAVVIMEMVAAQAAGVGFTCDPQTGRQDLFVVNANFGWGESVVSGAVEPDSYYLDASAWNAVPQLIKRKTGRKEGMTQLKADGGTHFVPFADLSSQQVLSDAEIEKLGLILLRVFEALGECEQHQDVEWAFDGRDFILLQSRPVTALPRYTFSAMTNKPEIWSNGNYRDAVPMVLSPLHRRLMKNVIDIIQYTALAAPGYPIPEGFQFSRFFQGRLYCNMSALQWANYDATGILPRDFNPFWGGHQPEIELEDPDPYSGQIGLERQSRMMKGVGLIIESAANSAHTFTEMNQTIKSLIGDGFDQIADRDFIAKYNELGMVIQGYSEKFNFLSGVGSFAFVTLMQKLFGYLGPRTTIVINGLMVGGEARITSADHGYRLLELAEIARSDQEAVQYLTGQAFNPLAWEEQLPASSSFKQAFQSFISDYGYRAVYELDIINPRWKEDPSYLLDFIKSTMEKMRLSKWKAEQKEKFDRAWQEVTEKVPANELEAIRHAISDAQAGAAVREMAKSVLVMAFEPYRLMALELGNRLSQRGILDSTSDIFYCSWSELVSILSGEWSGDGLRSLVETRKAAQKAKEALAPPDIIRGDEPVFSEPITQASGNFLQGVAAVAGKAAGAARLINHPSEGNRLQMGDVLVAPSTDPGWTPLFLKTCAIVMETGGFLSHGAIVAREYGVPAVVNVPGVMQVINDGQQVIVDGDEGKVFLQ